jgi:hypothetical protein
MRWIHFWRIMGVLALLDAIALGMWTVLGVGLRGTSYEEGSAEDEGAQALIVIGLSVALIAHIAVAAYGVMRGKREPWAASLGAAVMVPITLPVGIIVVGTAARLWFD